MQDVNHQLFTESVEEEMKVNLSAKYADGKYIDILKSLNLYHLLEKHPMSLSGGQKQRLSIVTAMVSDRDIIFLMNQQVVWIITICKRWQKICWN